MRLASYSLQTFQRPALLRECLRHLQAQEIPEGWGVEVIVAAPEGDPGIEIAKLWDMRPHPVKIYTSPGSAIAPQAATRLANVSGEIVLQTGDDDLQEMGRLRKVIACWETMTVPRPIGFDLFHFVSVQHKAVAEWAGPSHRAAATYAMPREWAEVAAKNIAGLDYRIHGDSQIARALGREGHDMSDYEPIDCGMVATDHGKNVQGSRPWPRPGQRIKHGDFLLTGVGWDQFLSTLPDMTRESLERLCTV